MISGSRIAVLALVLLSIQGCGQRSGEDLLRKKVLVVRSYNETSDGQLINVRRPGVDKDSGIKIPSFHATVIRVLERDEKDYPTLWLVRINDGEHEGSVVEIDKYCMLIPE